MKRIVSLVLALSMVLSMFTFAFAGTTLPDVAGTDYETAVSALVELGIVNGYEDGTYKPEKTVSRAEMAKFLVVSAGLEPAADVSKGATSFSDVAADHWAAGYINVATEYGYINGYPEGTFAPDATVSYAEAVTMAIRVLGYKTVVESKGTWPTNYIAKAQELKVLEDVDYGKYTDGAIRGNVATLMWNMLTTYMWDVTGENESNGLNYSDENGVTMIDKYFEDYAYIDEKEEIVVTDVDAKDGKVSVTLTSRATYKDENDVTKPVYQETFDLAKDIDFLNLFGRTVSVLYNEEDEEVVMVIPSNDDDVVEGYKAELVDDDYTFPAAAYFVWGSGDNSGDVLATTYTVNTLEKRKALESTIAYNIAGSVVEETKEGKTGIRVSCLDSKVYTLDEDVIVLIDGKWATADDIKVGDVLSELVKNELYVVSREVVEGKFEDLESKTNLEESTKTITVDGEEYDYYFVDSALAVAIEVDEDGEEVAKTALDAILVADDEDDEYKFYGEDVKLFLNYLGEVVRVEFNEITEEVKGNFYVATNCPEAYWTVTDKNGTTSYIELNGESYEVKGTLDASGDALATVKSGDVLLVEFDSKDRVKQIIRVDEGVTKSADYIFDAVVSGDNKEILDDYNYLSGDNKYKVTSSTVVYTITPVEDEEDENVVDHYEVVITKGAAALEGVKGALVAVESGDAFNKAAFVFVTEEAKSTEKEIGIVNQIGYKSGVKQVVIDDTTYEDVTEGTSFGVNDLVRFTENEGEVEITKAYNSGDIATAAADTSKVVKKVDGKVVVMKNDTTRVDLEEKDKAYEDAKIFVVTMTLDEDYNNIFESVEEVAYEDMKLRVDDILVEDLPNDTVLVIRNYNF